ncbi:hypothetical protein BU17DRAFT_70636 [Hysterangium stoloniferum]|nr:hypothetical protein BU17DRAFT_70636 [Hysterangium stoloniferum]
MINLLGFNKLVAALSGLTLTALILLSVIPSPPSITELNFARSMFSALIPISTWLFAGSTPSVATDVDIVSRIFLSIFLDHFTSDIQFKVLDMLTDISMSFGYQLPGFDRGFSPFAAAVTGFKLFANLDLNLQQAMIYFSWFPMGEMKRSLYSVCYNDVLHPFPKGNLATVVISNTFEYGPTRVAHLPHVLRLHIEETICLELKQRHAAVISDALMCMGLALVLLGAILYLIHSRIQNARHKPAADNAPAVDDANAPHFDDANALALDGNALALDGNALALDGNALALDGNALALDGNALALDGIALHVEWR